MHSHMLWCMFSFHLRIFFQCFTSPSIRMHTTTSNEQRATCIEICCMCWLYLIFVTKSKHKYLCKARSWTVYVCMQSLKKETKYTHTQPILWASDTKFICCLSAGVEHQSGRSVEKQQQQLCFRTKKNKIYTIYLKTRNKSTLLLSSKQ